MAIVCVKVVSERTKTRNTANVSNSFHFFFAFEYDYKQSIVHFVQFYYDDALLLLYALCEREKKRTQTHTRRTYLNSTCCTIWANKFIVVVAARMFHHAKNGISCFAVISLTSHIHPMEIKKTNEMFALFMIIFGLIVFESV